MPLGSAAVAIDHQQAGLSVELSRPHGCADEMHICCDPSDGPSGPLEHHIDAFQLRNEASFINVSSCPVNVKSISPELIAQPVQDFRDNVSHPNAAAVAQRSRNCAVVTVVVNGAVHSLVHAISAIDAGREVLLDYGEQYWSEWNTAESGTLQEHEGQHETAETLKPAQLDETAVRELETFEPMDRNAAREASCRDAEHWDWAELGRPPPTLSLPLRSETCSVSVAMIDPQTARSKPQVVFPASVRRLFGATDTAKLQAAVEHWLASGGGCPAIVLGKLLSQKHPAVAAAWTHADSKAGVAPVQLGVFARTSIAPFQILCEYQGVRLTSPLGCSPWQESVPCGRGSYLLGCTHAELLCGGTRQSLRSLPCRSSPLLSRHNFRCDLWAAEFEDWLEDAYSAEYATASSDSEDSNEAHHEENPHLAVVDSDEDDCVVDESAAKLDIALLWAKYAPEKLSRLEALIERYGAPLLLQMVTLKYSAEEAEEAESQLKQVLAVQAARRRRLWMAQLLAFISAPTTVQRRVLSMFETTSVINADHDHDIDTQAAGGRSADTIDLVAKERADFAWCIKYDPLTPVLQDLRDLELSTIDSLLQIFADHAINLPPCDIDYCNSGPHIWRQVLCLSLLGVQHDPVDPNVLLRLNASVDADASDEHASQLQLVATRLILPGEVLTCNLDGYYRMPPTAFPSTNYHPAQLLRQPARAVVELIQRKRDNKSCDISLLKQSLLPLNSYTVNKDLQHKYKWVSLAIHRFMLWAGVSEFTAHVTKLAEFLQCECGISPINSTMYLLRVVGAHGNARNLVLAAMMPFFERCKCPESANNFMRYHLGVPTD